MKYVLLAALLATLSPAQAGDNGIDVDCDARPYVGVCQEADPAGTPESEVLVAPTNPVPETDCGSRPYVGVCDTETEG